MKEKFLVVSDKGVVANGMHNPSEVLEMLLCAYLEVWNRDIGEIDVEEAGIKICDMLAGMSAEEDDDDISLAEALARLFGEDDDDGET